MTSAAPIKLVTKLARPGERKHGVRERKSERVRERESERVRE